MKSKNSLWAVLLVGLFLSMAPGCTRVISDKKYPSRVQNQQSQSGIQNCVRGSADENMAIEYDADEMAQSAFAIWKLMGYKPLSFFLEYEISVENLAELYTEFCLNSKSDDQILSFTQEDHHDTEYKRFINQYYFKMPGFIEFAQKLFNYSVDKTTIEKYEETIDAYPVSPSYLYFDEKSIAKISLESYEPDENSMSLYVNYPDRGVYKLKLQINPDHNFIFVSLTASGLS